MISNFKFPYKKIGVLGLGYVGLPIIKRLLQKKFDVLGFDIDTKKIQELIKLNISKKKFLHQIKRICLIEIFILFVFQLQ